MIMSILNKLSVNLHSITPHISEATNGIIAKLGLASVATGGTSAIVTKAVIVGSIMFVVNVSANVYFARKKDKREEEKQDKNNSL